MMSDAIDQTFQLSTPFPIDLASLTFTGSSGSASTQWGPGALTGKALKALGKLVIRTSDEIVVRRRLSSVRAKIQKSTSRQILSSTKPPTSADLADILELTRRGLYSQPIRRQALQLIFRQIVDRYYHQRLVIEVAKWPDIEVEIFVSELLCCLPDDRLKDIIEREEIHEEFQKYYSSWPITDQRDITRCFIEFITCLVQLDPVHSTAVVDGGFLHLPLLLSLATGRLDIPERPAANLASAEQLAASRCLLSCKTAIDALSASPDSRAALESHPFVLFWPFSEPKFLDIPNKTLVRNSVLCNFPQNILGLRLDAIYELMQHTGEYPGLDRSVLIGAFEDLLSLVKLDPDNVDVVGSVLRSLFRFVIMGNSSWPVFASFLDQIPRPDMQLILFNLIRAINGENPRYSHIIQEYKQDLLRYRYDDYLESFLDFCTSLGRDGIYVVDGLRHAGISSVILKLLSDFEDLCHFHPNVHTINTDQRRDLLEKKITNLTESIRNYGQMTVYDGEDFLIEAANVAYVAALSLSLIQDSNYPWKERTERHTRSVLETTLQDLDAGIWMCVSDKAQADRSNRLLVCFRALVVLLRADHRLIYTL